MSHTDCLWKVYCHTNKINGKKYIGITSTKPERRWGFEGHGYKKCPKFEHAILKYGWNNFNHEILFEGLTKEEASKIEIELIQKFSSIENGYNQEPGGAGGSHSEETKNKIRIARMKQTMTQETINKIASAHRGMKRSDVAVRHIKESRTKLYHAVKCIETNEIFDSITIAAEAKNVSLSGIIKSCKRHEKETPIRQRGLHWCYAD